MDDDERASLHDSLRESVEQMKNGQLIDAEYALAELHPANIGVAVRRVLLPRTLKHIYYAIRDNEVVVLSVWGAPRRRGPKLSG